MTLLFLEKVPRIVGLFWARFCYAWFETSDALGSTLPLHLSPDIGASMSFQSVLGALRFLRGECVDTSRERPDSGTTKSRHPRNARTGMQIQKGDVG